MSLNKPNMFGQQNDQIKRMLGMNNADEKNQDADSRAQYGAGMGATNSRLDGTSASKSLRGSVNGMTTL